MMYINIKDNAFFDETEKEFNKNTFIKVFYNNESFIGSESSFINSDIEFNDNDFLVE